MEKSRSQKLRLGIFVILGSVLLVLAAYFIGNKQSILGGSFEIKAVFKNINGLQTGNNVRFSGITVGTVKRIEMINDTTINIYMVIDDDMLNHIHKNAVAAIGSDGLVGSMIINIGPGVGEAPLIKPGDEVRTYSRIATEDMMRTLSVTNDNAALLTADLLNVTRLMLQGHGTVGKLLNDTNMAGDLEQAITNLKGISEEVNLAMSEVRQLIQKIRFEGSPAEVLLNDTASGMKVQSMIASLDSSGMIFKQTIENLNELVEKVKNGEGAINYLATDPEFAQNLDSTMTNIKNGAANFNENMEALKHNFLLRKYFKRQEAAKLKDDAH